MIELFFQSQHNRIAIQINVMAYKLDEFFFFHKILLVAFTGRRGINHPPFPKNKGDVVW